MPEKVRRIRKPLSSSTKKKIFFYGGVFLVAGALFFVVSSFLSREASKESVGIQDRKTATITCFVESCFLVNVDGVAFASTAKPSGSLFFLINSDIERPNFRLGDQAISTDTLAEVLFLRKKMKEDLDINIKNMSSNNFSDFDATTVEGWVLRFSVANNAPATLEVLKRVLDEVGSQRFSLEYIDLRLSNRVYYK